MAAFLVDESCPRLIAEALRADGHDVRYAAEADRRAEDTELVRIANAEARVIITEDFDFGELLVRRRMQAPGAVILFLPRSSPRERADRLRIVLARPGFSPVGCLSIVGARQVRQRTLLD